MPHPIIIIGTGLAGYQLAKEFRRTNSTLPLTLITGDDGRYYSKPQLSTALTSGKTSDTLATATAEQMAAQLNATIHTHTFVTGIDTQQKVIHLGNESLVYDKLVLALGAEVIKPQLAGEAVPDILSVNHIYHYSAFQDLIKNKKNITIFGVGLIGCEFANDLSNIGYHVDMIAPVKAPLDLLVPEEVGKILQAALEKNGVRFHLPAVATRMDKINNDYQLTLSNGETLTTELVLSAIGLRPHIALVANTGIQINRGIVVNRYLETSIENIYALGDCAEVEGHVLPYIAPLLNCSRALAKTLAGERTAVDYPAMPVVVKTPAHPIVICPPPKNISGEWQIQQDGENVRALFYDAQQKLYGFVLTHAAVKERNELAKQIPPLF